MRTAKSKNNRQLSFTSFGVKVGVRSNHETHLTDIKDSLETFLPNGFEFIDDFQTEHLLEIKNKKDGIFQLFKDGEIVVDNLTANNLLQYTESQIRLTVAEYAVGKVFMHAGVVGWKGRAILMPGSSYAGKSTLVSELIKQGAVYYSDEYAVFDESGLLYPYPKTLSLRGIIDENRQVECSAQSLGAETGTEPLEVGMVLICKYEKSKKNNSKFAPEILSAGQGMLEMLAHTIPIRFNPEFSLNVLYKISTRAIIAKSLRGEASEFARLLLDYLNIEFDLNAPQTSFIKLPEEK